MKRFLPIIILFIFLQGCKKGIPKEIIQPEKMEKVLFDLHVVDSYLSTLANPDTTKIVAASYYKGIYKKFNIDSALFNKSMDYYYSHPVILNDIYEKVEKVFAAENLKYEKLTVPIEDTVNVNSLIILKNIPITPKGFNMSTNPFDINLYISRL